MISSLSSWFKKDTARNAFVYTSFLIGLPFYIFNTYVVYQLQIIGFAIGTDDRGEPCTGYCLVPFGNKVLDLNSAILYMNAITFGIGGITTILFIAYADYWKNKTLLVIALVVVYGALVIPSYWLSEPSLTNFNALFALFIVFGVATLVLASIINIYIPYCMRFAEENMVESISLEEADMDSKNEDSASQAGRSYGFSTSIFGMIATALSGIVMLTVTAVLSVTLSGTSAQSAGLLVTTIVGFITVVGSVVSYLGLPDLPAKPHTLEHSWNTALIELFAPFKQLWQQKNMFLLLLSYTIYTDTSFASGSIIGQLYFVQIMPSTLEYTLYSLAASLFNLICTIIFYLFQRRMQYSLEKWLIFGYGLILVVPIWGCIGISDQVGFGDKYRWEFYVQLLITNISSSIVNPTFRLLYSELVPPGSEIMWFGLQGIVSCATTWITYVATGPLQSATHNLRFPLILCLMFFAVSFVLECFRTTNTRRIVAG